MPRCARSRMPWRVPNNSVTSFALVLARLTLGLALLNRRAAPERDRGEKLLADVSEGFLSQRHSLGDIADCQLVPGA